MANNDRGPRACGTREAGDSTTTGLDAHAGPVRFRGPPDWAAADVGGSLAARLSDPTVWVRGFPTPRLGTGVFLPRATVSRVVLEVELHAHSEASHDGRDPVDLLLEQAAAVGLDALAVTDHDTIEASLAAERLAPEYDLLGIPGIEITSAAGHVLGLGIREEVPSGLAFSETVAQIRDRGGVAVVPHPFQKSRHGVAHRVSEAALASVDAIEVYNSRLLTGRSNRRAERFAREHNMSMTAGSDAHISEMVGQAPTQVDTTDASLSGILDAIRSGKTSFEGKRTPWRISIRQALGGVRRRVQSRLRESW
jgi:predicted metal-dependent phosphoesterase TrpH